MEVAVKEQINMPLDLQSFKKQSTLIMKMKAHPLIVPIYGIVIEPKYMVVTEWVNGLNLQALLKKNLNLGWDVKKKFIQGKFLFFKFLSFLI